MELATQSEFDEVLNCHHNIQYVDAIFTDLCGYVRGKRFPVLEADKIFSDGVLLPFSAFYLDVLGGVTNTMNLGWTDGDPDGVLMPVKNSIKPVPWDSKVLQVLISMRKEQEKWGVIENPAEVDPRNILEKVMNKFKGTGFNPVVAFELEFYLLDKKRNKEGKPVPALGASKTHVYGIPDLDMFGDLFNEINENCKIQDIPATTASSEFAAGQYEINLKHTGDLLKAADDAAMLRRIIKETTAKHGFEATFMAKPFLEETGNGMHLHISVYDDDEKNIYNLLIKKINLKEGLQNTDIRNLDIFGSNVNLSGLEVETANDENRAFILKEVLNSNSEIINKYDNIFIDCPPSLSLLTIMALVSAKEILVPLQTEFFALEGVTQLMKTIDRIKNNLNPDLSIRGILLTMYDKRNKLSGEVEKEAREYFKEKVYETVVPRNVRLSEAPSHGMPVLLYDKSCPGSKSYFSFTDEFINQEKIMESAA